MNERISLQLCYGRGRNWETQVSRERAAVIHRAPLAIRNPREEIRLAINNPLDFPPLSRSIFPGDRITIVLDRHTPQTALLLQGVWEQLETAGVEPDSVRIVQPTAINSPSLHDPRCLLPDEARGIVEWKVHDATEEAQRGYLATTAAGERIYLAREVVESDCVLMIGEIAYDPVLGYRGTTSSMYPGLSSTVALAKAHRRGQQELGPDDDRPLRQMVDEIGWLIGAQFTLQVIASAGDGFCEVLAGLDQSVLRRGQELLNSYWGIQLEERVDTVVATIDSDAAGHGWAQLACALTNARNLVRRGGRILLVSEVDEEPGTGLSWLRKMVEPEELLPVLRTELPEDWAVASEIIQSLGWASVCLCSDLPEDLVTELGMIPVDSLEDATRLLERSSTMAILESAQHCFTRVR